MHVLLALLLAAACAQETAAVACPASGQCEHATAAMEDLRPQLAACNSLTGDERRSFLRRVAGAACCSCDIWRGACWKTDGPQLHAGKQLFG